jgi:glutamate-1-semialdehyde aminotransferase
MGVVAGKAKWMDGLDGGHWSFGDDSAPTVGVTYFAGTYVRHPLALATAKAVLEELKRRPGCQKQLNERTSAWVAEMNAWFKSVQAPMHIKHFSSMMKVTYTEELAYGELLYTMMREKGVHIWDQRPIFLTLAHSEADIAFVTRVFKECVLDMQASGFMPGAKAHQANAIDAPGLRTQASSVGARLGRDREGNPAWFVADPQNPGKYVQVEA